MFKKFSILNSALHIIFAGTVLSFLFLGQAGAQTITVSGTVFTDEGVTPMADGRTVRVKTNGLGDYSDVTTVSGDYTITNIPAEAGTTLTVFLDGAAEKGTTVATSDVTDIVDLDVYQNHVIIRSYSGASAGITLFHMAQFDKDQDPDILFDAENSAPYSLTVDQGNVFYIWSGCEFYPGYLIVSTIDVDDIKILGTYVAIWTIPDTYVSGDWTNQGTYMGGWGVTVTFDAASGTHYIERGSSSFDTIVFNDGGGGATWILNDALDIRADMTIVTGTLDVNSSGNYPINLEGDWSNTGGTFVARNGLVTFDDDAPNSRTITTGGSAFYNLTFSPSNASTPDLVSRYILESGLDVDNDLSISSGTLDTNSAGNNAITVGGDWTNLQGTSEVAKTLRPESDVIGRTVLVPTPGTGESNYEDVDEVTADDNTTYVATTNDPSWKYDYYGIPDPAGVCRTYSIEHIKIYFRCGGGSWSPVQDGGYARPVLSNGTDYSATGYGSDIGLTNVWATSNYTWSANPFTGSAWTWGDIDSLEIGVGVQCGGAVNWWAGCTQIYIEVAYIPYGFIANSGTVTFDGTLAQSITTGGSEWYAVEVTNASPGGISFVDKFTCATFTCTAPGARLNFKYQETDEQFEITASGGLHLEGNVSDYVYLRRYGGTGTDRWHIRPSGGEWTVSYVDVKDSINAYNVWINPSNSVDSGNTVNWFSSTVFDFADLILQNIDIQDDTPVSLSVTPKPGKVGAVQ